MKSLGLMAAVTFAGAQPLSQVSNFMEETHVFCLPSVRESGGAVILEAMASARPVIVLDYGGPAELVDDRVGRKVPATGNEASIQGIAEALEDAYNNPDAWRTRGLNGRALVASQWSWEAKINAALLTYEEVLSKPIPG